MLDWHNPFFWVVFYIGGIGLTAFISGFKEPIRQWDEDAKICLFFFWPFILVYNSAYLLSESGDSLSRSTEHMMDFIKSLSRAQETKNKLIEQLYSSSDDLEKKFELLERLERRK